MELEAVRMLQTRPLWGSCFRESVLYKARIPRDLQEKNRRQIFPPPGQLLGSDFSHYFA